MKKLISLSIVIMLFMVTDALPAQDSFKVIVNGSNTIGELSKSMLTRFFTKKVMEWDDGSEVLPIDLQRDSTVRRIFTQIVLQKDVASMVTYWTVQLFSGRSTPPVELETEEDILKYVQTNKGAIGYISDVTPTKGYYVKELEITE